MNELEEIRKRKREQFLHEITGGKKMDEKWPNAPVEVNDATIDETIKKYPTLVVDCWAPWCGPCRMIGPVIEELAHEMQGKITFGKLNVDENPQTSMKHRIMSIPTLLIFKKGVLVDRLVGALPKDMLKQKLETYH
ncbi:MAG: thioredoxin [Methanobacteriota archaeon]